MTDDATDRDEDQPFPIEIDVPSLSRVRNAISGGEANFSVDREVVESMAAATPNGLHGLQGVIEALHRFKMRAVRVVAGEAEIRQFLHVGTATPTTGMVYEHVLPLLPDARIVYASYDTTTLAHVHALWRDAPEGAVGHVHGPFDDPQKLLKGAAETLDFDQPVALMLPTTLNVLRDDPAQRMIDVLRDALTPGSYVVMAQVSLDIYAVGAAEVVEVLNAVLDEPYIPRTEAQIRRHLEGIELLDPGLVPIEQWRSEGDPPFLPEPQLIPLFGAVGRKP